MRLRNLHSVGQHTWFSSAGPPTASSWSYRSTTGATPSSLTTPSRKCLIIASILILPVQSYSPADSTTGNLALGQGGE